MKYLSMLHVFLLILFSVTLLGAQDSYSADKKVRRSAPKKSSTTNTVAVLGPYSPRESSGTFIFKVSWVADSCAKGRKVTTKSKTINLQVQAYVKSGGNETNLGSQISKQNQKLKGSLKFERRYNANNYGGKTNKVYLRVKDTNYEDRSYCGVSLPEIALRTTWNASMEWKPDK